MNTASEPNPLQLIRDALPTLTGPRRRVAELILADPQESGRNSITRLAELAQTQPATLTRLATALGYEGFPDLRAAVAHEVGREIQSGWESDIGTSISPSDSAEQVMKVLASEQYRSLRNAMSSIDLTTLTAVADAIAAARRVEIFGEWGDRPLAEEFGMRLKRIGVAVWVHDGDVSARISAGLLAEGDVALAVSRTADSVGAAHFLEEAKSRSATTVLITGDASSELAAKARHTLSTGSGSTAQSWTEYFAGRASDDFLGGVIWLLVAQRLKTLSSPATRPSAPRTP